MSLILYMIPSQVLGLLLYCQKSSRTFDLYVRWFVDILNFAGLRLRELTTNCDLVMMVCDSFRVNIF